MDLLVRRISVEQYFDHQSVIQIAILHSINFRCDPQFYPRYSDPIHSIFVQNGQEVKSRN